MRRCLICIADVLYLPTDDMLCAYLCSQGTVVVDCRGYCIFLHDSCEHCTSTVVICMQFIVLFGSFVHLFAIKLCIHSHFVACKVEYACLYFDVDCRTLLGSLHILHISLMNVPSMIEMNCLYLCYVFPSNQLIVACCHLLASEWCLAICSSRIL